MKSPYNSTHGTCIMGRLGLAWGKGRCCDNIALYPILLYTDGYEDPKRHGLTHEAARMVYI